MAGDSKLLYESLIARDQTGNESLKQVQARSVSAANLPCYTVAVL